MPFTLSHAAAVLPGLRRDGTGRGPLVASALVTGSFAPDLTYFAGTVVDGAMRFGDFTHSALGVLTVDALIAAALMGGWLLLREPLVALLPRTRLAAAYTLALGRSWRGVSPTALAARCYLSAVLGAATHIGWDTFTHGGRWGTRLLPFLDRPVGGVPLHAYLQYGTSAIALAALTLFVLRAQRRTLATPMTARAAQRLPALNGSRRLLAVALPAACALLGAVYRGARAAARYSGLETTWFDYVPSVLFGAGAGLALALPLFALTVRLQHRRRGEAPTPGAVRTRTRGRNGR